MCRAVKVLCVAADDEALRALRLATGAGDRGRGSPRGGGRVGGIQPVGPESGSDNGIELDDNRTHRFHRLCEICGSTGQGA